MVKPIAPFVYLPQCLTVKNESFWNRRRGRKRMLFFRLLTTEKNYDTRRSFFYLGGNMINNCVCAFAGCWFCKRNFLSQLQFLHGSLTNPLVISRAFCSAFAQERLIVVASRVMTGKCDWNCLKFKLSLRARNCKLRSNAGFLPTECFFN